jgi:hypothetical protein
MFSHQPYFGIWRKLLRFFPVGLSQLVLLALKSYSSENPTQRKGTVSSEANSYFKQELIYAFHLSHALLPPHQIHKGLC